MLHQLVAFTHAVNDGRTAQELDPNCKAAREIDTLFAWVRKQAIVQTALRGNDKTRKQG